MLESARDFMCLQEAAEQPDLYGVRRSGRQRKEVTRLSLGNVRMASLLL